MRHVGRRLVDALPDELLLRLKNLPVERELDYAGGSLLLGIEHPNELRTLEYCAKEPNTVRWIEEFVKPGDVLYDVGANIGVISLVAWAATGGGARIYSIEPGFSSYRDLCNNVLLNGAGDQIVPLHIALSDRTQMLDFRLKNLHPASAGSGHGLVDNPRVSAEAGVLPADQDPAAGRLSMMTFTLDDLIQIFELASPNHLKVDVDGSERKLLRGCVETLASPELRSIQIEVHRELDPDEEVRSTLERAGFELYEPFLTKHPGTRVDLVFVRNS